ncbi:hypothetical protein KXD93_24910 [Mucilaginibacter sp. BJC16-A38]|uniref:hypothetical protein n=1 Tax=Mucilaginibacter phenanthrenivorans TaxID=1234842 RepID=UPI00215720AF|nr:hypothetical protein [Mucilaginibacter phenanthrenivorans]MCR8560922.1 hypothetical protein [Mucilaginibacter phenanthrenivorans]
MKPEDVTPAKFHVHTIIYNNDGFSVAYGVWEDDKSKRLAMRWNGNNEEIGYPSQGGNPLWFQLPNESIWTSEILRAVDNINTHEKRVEDLDSKL